MSEKLTQGDQVIQDGNIFTGFTAAVSNHRQIRELYIKMKLCFPAAKHILCAYWIPGSEPHYNMDFCDDGETGSRRFLLDILKKHNMNTRVVFVTRQNAVSKIGTNRHECYVQAAKSAILKGGYNKILQLSQQLLHEEENAAHRSTNWIKGSAQAKTRGYPSNTLRKHIHQGSTPLKRGNPPRQRGGSTPPLRGHPSTQHNTYVSQRRGSTPPLRGYPSTQQNSYANVTKSPPLMQYEFSAPAPLCNNNSAHEDLD